MTVGHLVVGVYLYREVFPGIDKLNEQWEFIAEAVVVFLSQETVLLFTYELVKALTFVRAIGYDGLTATDT